VVVGRTTGFSNSEYLTSMTIDHHKLLLLPPFTSLTFAYLSDDE
jgi:hypothetical protein